MARMFGTDGVRGVANKELTPLLAFKLGRAGAYVLAMAKHHKPTIIVGCDTRLSCSMLENALVAGICSTGATAMCAGVIPTPAIAYLTRKYEADAGVMISASHNSFEFNGIKFFSDQGYKLLDETEDQIESYVTAEEDTLPNPVGENLGKRIECTTAFDDYLSYLVETAGCSLKGLKIVLDCANGASYRVAPALFEKLGADITVIHNEPTGVNINKKCGSTHMESLCEKVKEIGADIGFAFDGDADRLLAVDENGEMVDGDAIMSILAIALKKKGLLVRNTLVITIMSNMGVDIMAKANGIDIVKTKVGDRYVLEEMLKSGYVLGGEQSGHVIALQHNTTGDGLLTALKVAEIVASEKKKLSELASVYTALPQVLINAKVRNDLKYSFMENEDIKAMCEELENEFNGEGRVVIRPSGTEPIVRVMIEGKDYEYIKRRAELLAALIESKLGI
ncbi:MAG: phosphoglucosamine mutase [Clostridia bacterium]|nr:phosphoglucosamine mutase [Clostridia bacterium]